MVLSDETIMEIADLLRHIEWFEPEWHELTERQQMLLNIHFGMSQEAV